MTTLFLDMLPLYFKSIFVRLCEVEVEVSSSETYQWRREQGKCLHCHGDSDSAGHKGLRGDAAMIKTEHHGEKLPHYLESEETISFSAESDGYPPFGHHD